MSKRKILVILDLGQPTVMQKNVMKVMQDFDNLEMLTLVTGIRVPELGNSIDLIRQDGLTLPLLCLAWWNTSDGAWSSIRVRDCWFGNF